MNKLCLELLIIAILILLSSCNKDETASDLLLSSQEEVDNFNHSHISEDLTIRGEFIKDFTALSKIERMHESLFIRNNDMLKSLSGLENLKTIDSTRCISDNFVLSLLTGLSGLKHGGDFICIDSNKKLSSVSGLKSLKYFNGKLAIFSNHLLTNLKGLSITSPLGRYIKYKFCPLNENFER